MRNFIAIILVSMLCTDAAAQDDTSSVLSFSQYMQVVREHHPLALKAGIQPFKGEAAIRSARGAFDPVAGTNIRQKYFDGSRYYNLPHGGLKVPTWFGIELEAGYEKNSGDYLNPESTNPASGLWFAGISIPVGKGLVIDKRRAELQKAEIYAESALVERDLMLNSLFYDAASAYWEWQAAFSVLEVHLEALEVSRLRVQATSAAVIYGDRPAVDTLEADIQRQAWDLSAQEAMLTLANKTAQLERFLWQDGAIPLELDSLTRPQSSPWEIPDVLSSVNMEDLTGSNPEYNLYRYKLSSLEVERKLKKEQLKPELNLKYNALSEPVGGNPFTNYSISDYTWGLEFSMPLFLRKERGDLKLMEARIQETEFEMLDKQAYLNFNAIASLNTIEATESQIAFYTTTVENYGQLLEAERALFQSGESSLFMVNAREQNYINARKKLIDLILKNRKSVIEAAYYLGNLNSIIQ